MNRGQNAGFFNKPEKLQNDSNEGKGKGKKESARRRKEGEEKKAMVVVLVFIIATLVHFEIAFSKIRLN